MLKTRLDPHHDPQKEKERKAFEAFLQAFPSLAARIDGWRVQEEEGAFPDVLATLRDSQVLGFELGEWLHEDQVRQAKKTDQFDSDLLRAIKPLPENTTQHIHCVLLGPRNDRVRFYMQDHEKLRADLLGLIQEADQQWPNKRHWWSPQGYHCRESGRFPMLEKYLAEARFVPRVTGKIKKKPHLPGTPWIRIDDKRRKGSYSGVSSREALENIVKKKASHYGGSAGQTVNLLVHYGADAAGYNTPFMDVKTPNFETIAKFAYGVVRSFSQEVVQPLPLQVRHPFEKVYLCNTLPSELEAYEIFPQVLKCS